MSGLVSTERHDDVFFRELFDDLPDLTWAANPEGHLQFLGAGWLEYTGASPEALLGDAWIALIDSAHRPALVERWRAWLSEGKRFEMELPLRARTGLFRWFLVRAVPRRDGSGKLLRWVGSNIDIHATRELRELTERRGATALRVTQLAGLLLEQANARSEAEIVSVAVDHGMKAVGADTCALYRLDETGTTLELIEHRGTALEIVERVRRVTEAEHPAMFASMRSKEISWVETREDYDSRYPRIASTLRDIEDAPRRARSFWSAPLVVEGRPAGLLAMGFYDLRPFGDEERAFAHALAYQIGLALERLLQLERERTRHAQYATTLRSIGDAVITTDLDGRITLLNAAAERVTGWPEPEALGRPLDGVFDVFSGRGRRESQVLKVLRDGPVVGLGKDATLHTRTGGRTPIDDSAALIVDAGGNASGVVIVFRDVTEARQNALRSEFLLRAGAALASSLDYRATLATVAQLAVPLLADWCTIDLIEPGARASQQVAVAHVDAAMVERGRAFTALYPPDPDAEAGVPAVIRTGNAELHREIPESAIAASALDAESLRMIREMKLESAVVVPLRGRERIIGALSFIYAESGRRYNPNDLAFAEEFARRATMAIENARAWQAAEASRSEERALRREADIANTAKDEFLATISHELRTPLNAILGWTMTLRDQRPGSAELDEGLAIIERNAKRQARLIEDVLDVSRIISGKLTLTVVPIHLADVISLAVESVTPAADAKDVLIVVDAEPLKLVADPDRLQQVLWNLLTNAVKFSPRSAAISVRAYQSGKEIEIRVKDLGEGIPSHLLAQVFEPFRQADASTTRRHGGLGLGLAIVKQLVNAHGGTVEARSAGPGLGAELVVSLPARSTVPVSSTPPPALRPAEANARAVVRLDGLSVLVIDDEPDARVIVRKVLHDLGAEVMLAASAMEGFAVLLERRFDVLVSDIGMPDMDGYSLIRKVRLLPPAAGGLTPAIALSAYAQPEDVREAFAAGYQLYATKPVEPSKLAGLVAKLGISRAARRSD